MGGGGLPPFHSLPLHPPVLEPHFHLETEGKKEMEEERGRRRLIITTFVANKTKSNLGSQIRVNRTICSIFLDVGVLL